MMILNVKLNFLFVWRGGETLEPDAQHVATSERRYEVTHGPVILHTAREIIDVLHKHGIRHREIAEVMKVVEYEVSSQPVQSSIAYPNSR